jgi:hypothetical protein
MPSLRAGLNTAQQERATQLALASRDRSWASSWPVPPGSEWLIMPNREVPGRVPFLCTGRQHRRAWPPNPA